MITLSERTPLHVPNFHLFEHANVTYAIDAEAPNWIGVESGGAELLREISGAVASGLPLRFGELVARYALRHNLEAGKAWLHVHDFLSALGRTSMLFDAPISREPYAGRASYVQPQGLRELWLQIDRKSTRLNSIHT